MVGVVGYWMIVGRRSATRVKYEAGPWGCVSVGGCVGGAVGVCQRGWMCRRGRECGIEVGVSVGKPRRGYRDCGEVLEAAKRV